MAARVYALVILALVSAAFLMLTLTSSATFTAPTANPSNQLATATLAAPTGVSAIVQANGGTVRVAWTAALSTSAVIGTNTGWLTARTRVAITAPR